MTHFIFVCNIYDPCVIYIVNVSTPYIYPIILCISLQMVCLLNGKILNNI